MFWSIKNKPKEDPHQLKSHLTLVFSNGNILSWSVVIDKLSVDKRMNWVDFYTWYFCRTGCNFVLHYDKGFTVVQRKDILRFSIEEM